MKVCYIKNRATGRKIFRKNKINVEIKRNIIDIRKIIFLFIIQSFICVHVVVSKKYLNVDFEQILDRYFWIFSISSFDASEYFLFLFVEYIKKISVFTAFRMCKYSSILGKMYIMYQFIIFFYLQCVFILKFGLKGNWMFVLSLFPHEILFVLLLIYLLNGNKGTNYTKKFLYIIKQIIIVIICSLILSLLGSYVNLFIVKKLLI